jgi:divalent metal cation (Fe/Co/Zn/Cd) transporter
VLVDEALPNHEIERIHEAIETGGGPEVIGFHKLRTRRGGSRRYIDLHVQFRSGTSLERAHGLSHDLTDAIQAQVRGADVLIHLEPEVIPPVQAGERPHRDGGETRGGVSGD